MKAFLVAIVAVAAICATPAPALAGVDDAQMIGWFAAALTLLTFAMRSMLALRVTALAANLCFVSYGALMDLAPVLTLHLLLIPCNAMRLAEVVKERRHVASGAAAATRLEPSR
jgi:hypothetical protein